MKLAKNAEKILDEMTDIVEDFISKLPPPEQKKRLKNIGDYVSKLPRSSRAIARKASGPPRSARVSRRAV